MKRNNIDDSFWCLIQRQKCTPSKLMSFKLNLVRAIMGYIFHIIHNQNLSCIFVSKECFSKYLQHGLLPKIKGFLIYRTQNKE